MLLYICNICKWSFETSHHANVAANEPSACFRCKHIDPHASWLPRERMQSDWCCIPAIVRTPKILSCIDISMSQVESSKIKWNSQVHHFPDWNAMSWSPAFQNKTILQFKCGECQIYWKLRWTRSSHFWLRNVLPGLPKLCRRCSASGGKRQCPEVYVAALPKERLITLECCLWIVIKQTDIWYIMIYEIYIYIFICNQGQSEYWKVLQWSNSASTWPCAKILASPKNSPPSTAVSKKRHQTS